MSSLFISLYVCCLVFFSFVSHPIGYCLLLLASAVSLSCYCYLLVGFSWYLVLFCLVYIGGVYVLFVFVSVHNPNPLPSTSGLLTPFLLFFFFLLISFSFLSASLPYYNEGSHYLCSGYEGLSYCFFCLVLMVGFIAISVVCSEKDSFFR
nr:NADH dehydrogenase subunit 6 [Glypthelmins quieta]